MEKLITLLQEFYGENRRISETNGLITMTNGVESMSGYYANAYVCSKWGGFIKRLVENDKINEDVLDETENIVAKVNKGGVIGFYKTYEQLLMLLAISDSPIEFLLSIIK